MSLKVFEHALRFALRHYSNGGDIIIGGGEPTLHPHLLTFLGIAQRALERVKSDHRLLMITNGTCDMPTWKALRSMSYLDVMVSNSIFHDRALQNPRVMQQAGRFGWLMYSKYDKKKYRIAEVGRASTAAAQRAMRTLEQKRHVRIHMVDGREAVCSPVVLPDGQVARFVGTKPHVFGRLTEETYRTAKNTPWCD
jgi:organic radical activating enzyme